MYPVVGPTVNASGKTQWDIVFQYMPLLRLLTSGLRSNDGPQSSLTAASSASAKSRSKASTIPSPNLVIEDENEDDNKPSPPSIGPSGRRKSRLGTTLHLKPKTELSEAERERVYIKGDFKIIKSKCNYCLL